MKLVYIAGPFNGDIEKNCRNVEALACKLAEFYPQVQPVVPHSLGRVLVGVQNEKAAYEGTLELMRRCNAIMLAIDWEKSKGARKERREAKREGMPIFYECDLFDPFGPIEAWLKESP